MCFYHVHWNISIPDFYFTEYHIWLTLSTNLPESVLAGNNINLFWRVITSIFSIVLSGETYNLNCKIDAKFCEKIYKWQITFIYIWQSPPSDILLVVLHVISYNKTIKILYENWNGATTCLRLSYWSSLIILDSCQVSVLREVNPSSV